MVYALHVYLFRGTPELAEDAQGVGEGGRAALDTVVNVWRVALGRDHIHGARHTASHGLPFEDGDSELVWVL